MTVGRAGATALAYGLLLPAVTVSLALAPVTVVVHAVAHRRSDDPYGPPNLTPAQRALFESGKRVA